MNSEPPVILFHYGLSPYLKYSFECLRTSNPNKSVILLGDESNKSLAKQLGFKHLYFDRYLDDPMLREFDEVYERVGGTKFEAINIGKGTSKDWTKFNFQKWFVLHDYVKSHKISSFWTFDSDNMVVSDLKNQEVYFKGADYGVVNGETEYKVMQGLVNNVDFLKSYKEIAIQTFKDKKYLEHLRETEFRDHPNWGFTMMRLFGMLYENLKPKVKVINEISLNGTFDMAIAHPINEEVYDKPINGWRIKKVFFDKEGNFYEQNILSGEFFPVYSINLSWLPLYTFDRILEVVKKNKGKTIGHSSPYFLLDLYPSRFAQIKQKFRNVIGKF